MDKQAHALRVMEDLLRYGNSTSPCDKSLRHKITRFVTFNEVSYTVSITPSVPPQLQVVWKNDPRAEEVGRQVFDVLSIRRFAGTYEPEKKRLLITLGDAVYTAIDMLDTELQPLRTVAPTQTIGTPTPPTHGKIAPESDNEIAK